MHGVYIYKEISESQNILTTIQNDITSKIIGLVKDLKSSIYQRFLEISGSNQSDTITWDTIFQVISPVFELKIFEPSEADLARYEQTDEAQQYLKKVGRTRSKSIAIRLSVTAEFGISINHSVIIQFNAPTTGWFRGTPEIPVSKNTDLTCDMKEIICSDSNEMHYIVTPMSRKCLCYLKGLM